MNGIPCGPTEEPHDYYTTFFSNRAGTDAGQKPFYYTALLKFYDDEDYNKDSVNNRLVEEWCKYGKGSNKKDGIKMLYSTSVSDLTFLAESIKHSTPLPASLSRNTLAESLWKNKKIEAANYLVFAKIVESFTTMKEWEAPVLDSVTLGIYLKEANKSYNASKDPFIKTKYVFQMCKLAFYDGHNLDCIRVYNEYFTDNTSAVKELALRYKAGSEFKLGRNKESAYSFSKAFAITKQFRKANFEGFLWATKFCDQSLLREYTAICKNDKEKAVMTAMFGLYGTSYHLEVINKVYEMDPLCPLLPLLATREINKLEEQYFTPLLSKQKGGKSLYLNWDMADEKGKTKQISEGSRQVENTAILFQKISKDQRLSNRSFYGVATAYLRFMRRDNEMAKSILERLQDEKMDEKLSSQMHLVSLLIGLNETSIISPEREAILLPDIQWLVQKAKGNEEYTMFARNLFSEILAQKYEQQGDPYKAALAYGMAEKYTAVNFIQNEMNTANLVKLYKLQSKPSTTAEKYFVTHSSLKRDDVVDMLGTSYLRDHNYTKAIEWLSKESKHERLTEEVYNYNTSTSSAVFVNPFYDYLNDWQRLDKGVSVPYTKLSLAKELLAIIKKINDRTTPNKSQLYYQYASALYNMSFYGNSWDAVAYFRSSDEWNDANYNLKWQKEYYGVFEAAKYYHQAYLTATDKEFKAACLFMEAKCIQKQVQRPGYDYSGNYDIYKKAYSAFEYKFFNNPLFGKFKEEFGSTKYYQYVYNRCSYLRDYVNRKH
jgi:hypothetical protein